MINAETIKRLDMVTLLTEYYGMNFEKIGGGYRAHSIFSSECNPSFFVGCVAGHWLFNDFSSGYGGSLIDFVQIKEKLGSISATLAYIETMLGGFVHQPPSCSGEGLPPKKYDIDRLYHYMDKNDKKPAIAYLKSRGIGNRIIDILTKKGLLLNNCRQGKSYCCFVVKDMTGKIRCLDNHEIRGPSKFVLGEKHIFTWDYDDLAGANGTSMFITEGIIDYLSIKELEGMNKPGLALLGNRMIREPPFWSSIGTIVSALDNDRGGNEGVELLKTLYPQKQIIINSLEGAKDPNQLLLKRRYQNAIGQQ